MNSNIVKCPKCGANLEISFQKQSTNKAEEKIEALRKAGVNTSNLFSIRSLDGTYKVVRLTDGEFSEVPDSDPVFKAIYSGKVIPDRHLFRRWVMAQVFHMMCEKDYRTGKPMAFTAALRRKGYKYQWKMVVEEFRVQAKLAANDPENFAERNRWFNRKVVLEMANDYIKLVRDIVDNLRVRSCRGVPYVRLCGTNIFMSELPSTVFQPLEQLANIIKNTRQPTALYNATANFYYAAKRICLYHNMEQSKAFKDAYKGAGAFYTLKNLILFHECVFPTMNQKRSLNHLQWLAAQKDFAGYKLFGVLKEFLISNNIDIAAKRAEWQK